MHFPKLLRKGAVVALLAGSSPGDPALLEPSVQFLEQRLQVSVMVMESCRSRQDYLAGSDALRARDIHQAFADRRVDALFFWRGGYGMQRVLPLLDFEMIGQNPKIVAGYSDVTALHMALNQICSLVTYHAPMTATELRRPHLDPYTFHSFVRHVFENPPSFAAEPPEEPTPPHRPSFLQKNPAHLPMRTIAPGKAAGRLTGGNLSLVVSSLGTPFEIDTTGKILFLEEIQEAPYRIDRMLLQLKLARKFRDCAGILLGSFHPESMESLQMAVNDLLLPEDKPILADIACGHTLPCMTLPLGAMTWMDASRHRLVVQTQRLEQPQKPFDGASCNGKVPV